MKNPRVFHNGIVAKLLLMNVIILLASGGVILVNFFLTRQIGNALTSIIENDIPQVINNAELSRNINKVFSDTHLLLNTFLSNKKDLTSERKRLLLIMETTISENAGKKRVAEILTDFRKSLETLLDQCNLIVLISDGLEKREAELETEINDLDRLVTNLIITKKITGKNYELLALSDASASIPDYRSILLQIKLHLSSDRYNYLFDSFQDETNAQILEGEINELNSGLFALTTAGDELAFSGHQIIQTVKLYTNEIREFYDSLRQFQIQLKTMDEAQLMVMEEMKLIDSGISRATGDIQDSIRPGIQVSESATIVLSLIVIIVLGIAGIYAVKITKPIVILTNSAIEIAEGDFHIPVECKGTDEVASLSRSFEFMRVSIQQKIIDMREEIDERKKIEKALRESEEHLSVSLGEKELLLRELYHRTKNNMQVISAMLHMKAITLNSKEADTLVLETDNRIQAMALVHRKLYESKDLSKIQLDEYLVELSTLLIKSYQISVDRISIIYDFKNVEVLIDTAIPCGLILNELISNALTHGFPDEKNGIIKIHLARSDEGYIELSFSDNGLGVPKGFDARAQETMGMQTIFNLGEQQLKGKIRMDTEKGLAVHLVFLDNLYKERV